MNSIRNESNKKKNTESIFTSETFGVVLILFSALCLVCLITRDKVFSLPGRYVCDFLTGLFGYMAVAVSFSVFVLGILLLLGKSINVSKKHKFLFTAICFFVSMLLHVISMKDYSSLTYSEYLEKAYALGEGGLNSSSCGGITLSLVAYFFSAVLTNVGAYVIISVITAILVYLLFSDFGGKNAKKSSELRTSFVSESPNVNLDNLEEKEYPVEDVAFNNTVSSKQKLFVNDVDSFAMKSRRESKKDVGEGIKIDYSASGLGIGVSSYQDAYALDMEKKINYIKTPAKLDLSKTITQNNSESNNSINISKPIKDFYDNYKKEEDEHKVNDFEKEDEAMPSVIPFNEYDESENNTASAHARDFSDKYMDIPNMETDNNVTEEPDKAFYPINNDVYEDKTSYEIEEPKEEVPNVDVDFNEEPVSDFNESTPPISNVKDTAESIFNNDASSFEKKEATFDLPSERRGARNLGFNSNLFESAKENKTEQVIEPVKEEKPKVQPPINRKYNSPPIDLLEKYDTTLNAGAENHEERMDIIKRTLEEFHINADTDGYVQGPSITRYAIKMPAGISVKKVGTLDDDLRMRLKSVSGVRIEAPIPGKDLVGIEVANNVKIKVGLRELMEQSAKTPSKKGALTFAIGKDIVGNAITDNLAKGPHYLVAGATGSGKSVCLNVMIVSMLMKYSPEDLRFILVDPKGVEFGIYEHLPHLMIDEIINDPQKALAMLQWAYIEMERRFNVFKECSERIVDIESYNERIACATVAKMPRIVIVIDELADLMETCKKDMEARIRAIAQKSRAVGIHLVLATQRPSVDIITGTIKANLPSRIALKVMNFADSTTILGEGGAEKLLGNGDMLYKNSTMGEYQRYQGAYLTDEEITNIVEYIKENNKAYFDDDLSEYLENSLHPKQDDTVMTQEEGASDDVEQNDIFIRSLALVIRTGTASISLLQRRFQIGYAKAGWIVDQMERRGYVTPNEGSKARKVLITREQFESKYGEMSDDI